MLSFPCAIEYPEYWVEHNEDDDDFKLVLLDNHGQDLQGSGFLLQVSFFRHVQSDSTQYNGLREFRTSCFGRGTWTVQEEWMNIIMELLEKLLFFMALEQMTQKRYTKEMLDLI